ncbi:MAG: class I SAM-dependent methyltransferase [Deltaproteobacteria bacterium]|nr:class I SAM-dependent methyltransferase [Deltaproteobacteria bacterium]
MKRSRHADMVSGNWDSEWKRQQGEKGGGSRGGALAGLLAGVKGAIGGSALTRGCCSVLRREAGGAPTGLSMLEAGCGTSNIAVVMAGEKARCFQFDISDTALEISKETFRKVSLEACLIKGDLFRMPFEDASFDIVWNVGVLEHFPKDLQDSALREMVRVCRPKGRVVTFNPYARGYIYRAGKWLAEKTGRWTIGYEVPVKTLRPNLKRIDPALKVHEYSFGFLLQFLVFKHLIRKNRAALAVYSALYEAVNLVLAPLNRLPGFLLVTVIERER